MHVKVGLSRIKTLSMGDAVRFSTYANGCFVGTTTMANPKLSVIKRHGNEYYLLFRNNETMFSMFCHEVVRE